jgi:hypothetical protein
LEPGQDIDATLVLINTHLSAMEKASVNNTEIQKIRDQSSTIWTAKVVSDYQAKRAAEVAKIQPVQISE